MSFNSHLAFNISKATPTTSTTNATTTSASSGNNNEIQDPVSLQTSEEARKDSIESNTNSTTPRSPLLRSFLTKATPTTSEPNNPRFNTIGATTTTSSDVTPATASYGDATGGSENKNKGAAIEKDLIGLFDKFDVENNKQGDGKQENADDDDEEELDPVVEKFRRFSDQKRDALRLQDSPESIHNEKVKENASRLQDSPGSMHNEKVKENASRLQDSPWSTHNEKDKENASSLQDSPWSTHNEKDNENEPSPKREKQTRAIDDLVPESISNKDESISNKDESISNKDEGMSFNSEGKEKADHSGSEKLDPTSLMAQAYEAPHESKTSKELYTPLTLKNAPSKADSSEPEQEFNEKDENREKELEDITGVAEDQEAAVEEYELKTSGDVGSTSSASSDVLQNSQRNQKNLIKETPIKVNPEEQYQQSHKPFDFQTFLAHLKKRSADPIVRYIRSFLGSFSKQYYQFSSEQKIKLIGDFKAFINEKFELYEPFASMDDLDLENSREGIEKLVMNRLYDFCFPPTLISRHSPLCASSYKDIEDDYTFSQQADRFSWLDGHHLDVDLDDLTKFKAGAKKEDLNFMEYAITELNKINKYRAPRDKIICILNSCKIIFSFLKVSSQETNADAFMPLLILITIKAKTPNLISNIHYIENYRGVEWLNHGETSYYLSSLQGAVGFIQSIAPDKLTINEDEYNAHIEAWEAGPKVRDQPLPKKIAQPQPQHVSDGNPAHQQSLSPSNVLFTSAGMFTKTLSNFLSPSPQEPSPLAQQQAQQDDSAPQPENTDVENSESDPNNKEIRQTYKQLKEVFPTLDKAILKDIVIMNKGDLDQSLEACLQLVNEV